MKAKKKIKIIRKEEAALKTAARTVKTDSGTKSARKIVNNVSNWVTDLQRRKRAETKDALDKLFPANPQTDSA